MTKLGVLLCCVAAACDVGSVLPNGGPNPAGPDGGNPVGGGDGSGSSAANCVPVNPTPQVGHHNAGLTCVSVGCHLNGQTGAGAPPYSYGGTLWRDAGGQNAYAGATVIINVGGTDHKLITDTLGNFFIDYPIAPPPTAANTGTTAATACPTMMLGHGNGGPTTPLIDGGGNCNSCHVAGGTAGAVIHL